MGGLFGKPKKVSRVTNQDRAVLQMKQQRDKVKQYQTQIEQQLEKNLIIAKCLVKKGMKERAKLLLKKKRYLEQLLLKTDNQLETIEKLVQDVEFAQIESQVFQGLKEGNEALKELHKAISIDEIEDIMEETKAGVEKQREIDEILLGALTDEDELAIEEEFKSIIKEAEPIATAVEGIKIPEFPEVPVGMPDLPEISIEESTLKDPAVNEKPRQKIALEAS